MALPPPYRPYGVLDADVLRLPKGNGGEAKIEGYWQKLVTSHIPLVPNQPIGAWHFATWLEIVIKLNTAFVGAAGAGVDNDFSLGEYLAKPQRCTDGWRQEREQGAVPL